MKRRKKFLLQEQEKNMNEFDNLMAEARGHLEQKQFKQAVDAYLQVRNETGDNRQQAIVQAELSWAYYGLQDYRQAFEAARQTLELNRQYEAKEDIYRVMGLCSLALNNQADAEKYLQKSLDLDRSSEKQQVVLYEVMKIYFKKQTYARALKIINEIETYFYQNQKDYWLSILFYKGFVYYYQNDLQNSEHVFEELLENSADGKSRATALFGLAFVNYARKEYLKTINLCEAVLKSDPAFFDPETLGFLSAGSFFHLGRKDVFDKYHDQLVKNYPNGRYLRELEQMKAQIKN